MNWLSEPSNLPPGDHGPFNQTIDPAAFMQPNSAIDPSQFQSQHLFNNTPRNASPAFRLPSYNVTSVVPSKRPGEDNLGASPRQAPGNLPGQRSQTPQQAQYGNYNGAINGNQGFAQPPTPFQHLQQGPSSTATPSPVMQSQQFNPMAVPQRVQTASPAAFSQPRSQMSPEPASTQGSRGGTPQNGLGGYNPYGGAFNPGLPGQSMPMSGVPASMMQQQIQMPHGYPQQQNYQWQMQQNQIRVRQAAHNANIAAHQARPPSSGMNPMAKSMNQMQNPQMARQMASMRQRNSEEVLKSIQDFNQSRNLPFDPAPILSGRQTSLLYLWQVVRGAGGHRRVTERGQWQAIAESMKFPHIQYPNAAQELQNAYTRFLAAYETFADKQRMAHAQEQQQQQQSMMQPRQSTEMIAPPNKSSPVHAPGQQQALEQAPPLLQQTHMRAISSASNSLNQAPINGFATPSANGIPVKPPNMYGAQRSGLSTEMGHPNLQQNQYHSPSPAQSAKRVSSADDQPAPEQSALQMPVKQPIEDPFRPTKLAPSRMHGRINVDEMFQIGSEVATLRPIVPLLLERGVIDIHALTMSLKCGIAAEVHYALNTLCQLSVDPNVVLQLDKCDDLVESLVDCAEDQLDLLAENTDEVSDDIHLPTYEDIIRGYRAEMDTVPSMTPFGCLEYDLDKAVERLITIVMILRNFSFLDHNQQTLVIPEVIKLLATVIRYIGTRNMILRTHRNTLDFMKDAVTFMSNLSNLILLPGKEEALCILHFLLSFAPCPAPSVANKDILFAFYNPNLHKLTPHAIDGLAKLLARDDPNRMLIKSIFAADSSYDLLTRTFALAICPLPDPVRGNIIGRSVIPIVEARKPYLLQGLLAAEIVANLVPSAETGIARSWLTSTEGFALTLLRLVNTLATDRNTLQAAAAAAQAAQTAQQQGRRPPDSDPSMYNLIIHRGLTVLIRLAEKAKNPDLPNDKLPPSIFPSKVNLLGAMGFKEIDPHFLKLLRQYSALED